MRVGRVILGVAVGASFGIAIGALVASWIWGVAAIEGEAVSSSYLAGGITLVGAAVGGLIGFRSGGGALHVGHGEQPILAAIDRQHVPRCRQSGHVPHFGLFQDSRNDVAVTVVKVARGTDE